MKTSYRIIETFHEGSPILVQRALATGDGFETYETIAQINYPVTDESATALRVLVCECQELADKVDELSERESGIWEDFKVADAERVRLREEVSRLKNQPAGE